MTHILTSYAEAVREVSARQFIMGLATEDETVSGYGGILLNSDSKVFRARVASDRNPLSGQWSRM